MRRMILTMVCVAMLVLAGSTVAMAKGPHHGGRGHGGHGPGHGHGHGHGHHHHVHRHAHRPYYVARPPRVVVPACPVPVPVAPVYPAYPRLGFGLGGSNFSFWFQQ